MGIVIVPLFLVAVIAAEPVANKPASALEAVATDGPTFDRLPADSTLRTTSAFKSQPADVIIEGVCDECAAAELLAKQPKASGKFFGGGGILLIQPRFDGNPAFAITNDGARQVVNFDTSLAAAPIFWIGYLAESGVGTRFRYWTFQQAYQESTTATVLSAASAAPLGQRIFSLFDPSPMVLSSNLRLQSMDWEVIDVCRLGVFDTLLGAGLRYAHISQNYAATESGFLIDQSIQSGQNIDGLGPTVVIEPRYAIGDSGLSIVAAARGSLLFGRGHQRVNGNLILGPFVSDDIRDTLMPVAEIELGGQYAHSIGRAMVFFRPTLVAQSWFGAGNASRSYIPATRFESPTTANANLGFLGLSLTAGLDW